MSDIPDRSVGLSFTSPPYNVGKTYESDLDMEDYLALNCQLANDRLMGKFEKPKKSKFKK
jgi:DNA modification methylase